MLLVILFYLALPYPFRTHMTHERLVSLTHVSFFVTSNTSAHNLDFQVSCMATLPAPSPFNLLSHLCGWATKCPTKVKWWRFIIGTLFKLRPSNNVRSLYRNQYYYKNHIYILKYNINASH